MQDNTPLSDALVIKIPLSKGKYFAIVSPEDEEYVNRFVWSAVPSGSRVYAVRSEKGNNTRKLQLSREIMERMIGRSLVEGETVRHRRRASSLDYTRDNLILKGRK